MEALLGLFGVGIVLFIFTAAVISFTNMNALARLKDEVEELRRKVNARTPEAPAKVAAPVSAPTQAVVTITIPEPAKPEIAKPQPVFVQPKPERQRKATFFQSTAWKWFEKAFLENWTGVLGAAAVVAGLTFLGIYTAFNLSPLLRVLLLIGVSLVLAVLSFLLQTRKNLKRFSLWLQSVAVAVVLVACLGSGGIPGLTWIEDRLWALLILSLGVFVNILFAFFKRKSSASTLHVLLGLLALGIAGPSPVISGVMGVVALSGLLFSFGQKREFHLASITVSLVLAHLVFLFSHVPSDADRLVDSLVMILGFSLAHLLHYQRIYEEKIGERKALASHLVNYAAIAVGILFYAPHANLWVTLGLAAAAALISVVAHLVRVRIRWLFISDSLLGFFLALLAGLSLLIWNQPYLVVLLVLFVEAWAFTVVMVFEKETLLSRVGFLVCCFLLLVLAGFALVDSYFLTQSSIQDSLVLGVAFVFGLFVRRFAGTRLSSEQIIAYVYDFTLPFLAALASFLLIGKLPPNFAVYPAYFFLPAIVLLLWIPARFRTEGTEMGLLVSEGILSLVFWLQLAFQPTSLNPVQTLLFCTPLVGAALLSFFLARNRSGWLFRFSLFLLAASLGLSIYYLTNPVSSLIPSIGWLLLGLTSFEISRTGAPKGARDLKIVGLFFLAAFLSAYFLVDLQSEFYLGWLKARFWVALLAAGVFVQIFLFRSKDAVWETNFLEVTLAFFAVVAVVELPAVLQPVVWGGAALFFSALSHTHPSLRRLAFYGTVFFWAACIQTAFTLSPAMTPSKAILDSPVFWGTVAVIFELAFLVWKIVSVSGEKADFPSLFRWLGWGDDLVKRKPLPWHFFPFFLCVAFFFYWCFDPSILTLLWSGEAFGVFVLAIIFKDNLFRYTALVGLAGCLVRLVFFDLSKSDTLSRALVFIGVGVLMMLMNFLYSSFRERLKK